VIYGHANWHKLCLEMVGDIEVRAFAPVKAVHNHVDEIDPCVHVTMYRQQEIFSFPLLVSLFPLLSFSNSYLTDFLN
jgi:hypothetical protein